MPVMTPQKSLLQRQLLRRGQSSQQGLTILECLVAIMLIGITIAMVTPPLLIATASRVQTRRGEQALQVAQDEIDRINTLVQRGLHKNSLLPTDAGQPNVGTVPVPTKIANFIETTRSTACPAGAARYADQQLPVTDALPIDVDGDCDPDFFMQVFRNDSSYTTAELQKSTADRRPARFNLGVRVYSKLVDTNKTLTGGNLKVEPASFGLTIGQGQQATNPLAVVYKEISWGERSEVLCEYATPAQKTQITGCS